MAIGEDGDMDAPPGAHLCSLPLPTYLILCDFGVDYSRSFCVLGKVGLSQRRCWEVKRFKQYPETCFILDLISPSSWLCFLPTPPYYGSVILTS